MNKTLASLLSLVVAILILLIFALIVYVFAYIAIKPARGSWEHRDEKDEYTVWIDFATFMNGVLWMSSAVSVAIAGIVGASAVGMSAYESLMESDNPPHNEFYTTNHHVY